MITYAFTCTGPYAVLIMLGIKRVENRSVMPEPAKGRCGKLSARSRRSGLRSREVERVVVAVRDIHRQAVGLGPAGAPDGLVDDGGRRGSSAPG